MESKKLSYIAIEQATSFSPDLLHDVQRLAATLGKNYKELGEEDLRDMISSPNMSLLVAKHENKIIGIITLIVYRIPYVRKAYLDDLVVDEAYRGQGIGTQLMEKALLLAKEKGASYIDFTSRPRRSE